MADAAAAVGDKKSAGQMIKQYFIDFKVLKDNPREYWSIQIVNFLDSAAYFAMFAIVSILLSQEEVGFIWGDTPEDQDIMPGYVLTAFTLAVTVSLFFMGFITDTLGIKKSLSISMLLQAVTRVGVVACGFIHEIPGREWIAAGCLVLWAPGMAMGLAVYQSSNRRFSSTRSRAASFLIWYMVMNIGAAVGGLSVDFFRHTLGLPNRTYVFIFAAGLSFLAFILNQLLIRKVVQVRSEDEDEQEAKKQDELAQQKLEEGIIGRFLAMVREPAFWRLVVIIVATVGVRAAFIYMYTLAPKYWERVIGKEVALGTLQSLNPFLIVIFSILFVPLANKFNVYKMLIGGAFVSAISLFFLAVPYQTFGNDVVVSYYAMSILFLVMLSFGEIVWSPKLQEFTAAIAPQGQEGAYLGMSMVPWFFAKFLVSFLSGHMLVRWCPEGVGEPIREGTLSYWEGPEAMWLILAIWAVSGPVIGLIFKGWLTRGIDLDPPDVKKRKQEAAEAEA